MPTTASKPTSIVEDDLSDLRRVRASGGATGERSTYAPLANLLNAVGATLRPKAFCVDEVQHLTNTARRISAILMVAQKEEGVHGYS